MGERTSKIIASRLANAREDKNYSQADVCRLGAFHKASYSNWENGRRTPSLDDAKKLENILGVSAAYILNLTNSPQLLNGVNGNINSQIVPVYNSDILEKPRGNWQPLAYIPVHKEYFGELDKNTFGFSVSDDCMDSIVLPGDIILITPYNKPKHGDVTLIKSKSNNLVFLRFYQLISSSIDEKIIELKPSNDSCPIIKIEDESKIFVLGVARNKIKIIL